jgi:CheY-like chemotaxis protein
MTDKPASLNPVSIPPGAPAPEGTVLVVDGDRVSGRFVELALSAHGLAVEIARDAAAAFEVLRTTTVDLIVCDTALPDLTGSQLMRRIAEDAWYRHIPVIFLSAEARLASKVQAFRAGAEDYLTKPVDKTELAARCVACIYRHFKHREEARRRPYSLAGDFTAIPFADLVVMLSMGRRTGTLYIVTKGFSGQLVFEEGNLIHALSGNVAGHAAFYRMLADPVGHFELDPTPPSLDRDQWTVTASVNALLMEGARIHDEAERDSVGSAPAKKPRRLLPSMPPPSSVRVLSGLPTPASATVFEEGLSDQFTLGELQLWNVDQLREWTSTATAERFHVLLVADPPVGTAALLALASSTSQRFIMKSLSPDPKVLGLTFFLRRSAEVDILLLDVKSAAAFADGLRQLPCLVIIAPPDGDFLAAGVRGRSELEQLLEKLMPPVMIGVGNPSLGTALQALPAVSNGICKLRTFTGTLGAGSGELRSVLVEGVRLWEAETVDR